MTTAFDASALSTRVHSAVAKSDRPAVCIVSPGLNGGVRRLTDYLLQPSPDGDLTQMEWLVSTSGGVGNIALFPLRLARLLVHAAAGRHDLYHFNLASRGSTLRKLLFSLPLRVLGRPYVIHLHGGGYREFYAGLPRQFQRRVQSFFRHAARVIVLGNVWKEFIVQDVGVAADRVVILANAVAGPVTLPERRAGETPKLLFLGRLGAGKGVPELLEALAHPEMVALPWTATIAGDGEVDFYRRQAEELGLAHRVDFPGWVAGKQVSALLTDGNILVLPSHAENLPLSMLEGMGYGLCPVVTPVGAVEDVIRDGENGLLVPVGDAAALAAALARVCADGALRQRLGDRARAGFLAHYDIRNYRARLESIYLDAIRAPMADR